MTRNRCNIFSVSMHVCVYACVYGCACAPCCSIFIGTEHCVMRQWDVMFPSLVCHDIRTAFLLLSHQSRFVSEQMSVCLWLRCAPPPLDTLTYINTLSQTLSYNMHTKSHRDTVCTHTHTHACLINSHSVTHTHLLA